MANLSCAFFGHKKYNYSPYENDIRETVEDLINRGVTDFYNCNRGQFDKTCAQIVYELKAQYPHVNNILVLSYTPDERFELPKFFDKVVYLSEKIAPYVGSIEQFNQKIVETVSFVVSGVERNDGDSKVACDYAKSLRKSMYNVITDEEEFWYGRAAADGAQTKMKRVPNQFNYPVWVAAKIRKAAEK